MKLSKNEFFDRMTSGLHASLRSTPRRIKVFFPPYMPPEKMCFNFYSTLEGLFSFLKDFSISCKGSYPPFFIQSAGLSQVFYLFSYNYT